LEVRSCAKTPEALIAKASIATCFFMYLWVLG
jgi:hypothetical protein